MVLGVAVALTALLADVVGLSSRPGFGATQIMMLLAGQSIAAWGLTARWPRAAAIRNRIAALVISLYVALWVVEVLVTYPLNPRLHFKMPVIGLQWMYEVGDQTSYRLAPGYSGVFDDGIVQAEVQINSRGDRDDEPRLDHPWEDRVLLIGDSQTWGHGIPRAEMIDRRLEFHSGDTLDAYSLAVPGYGAGDSLLRFSETDWWRGRRVVYVFFVNDLQNDNVEVGQMTIFNGFPVPRRGPDGQEYTPEQWEKLIARAVETGHDSGEQDRFSMTFTLVRLRGMVTRLFDRNATLIGYPDREFGPDNVARVLEDTAKMRALATERGASFSVVVIPAVGEASAERYSDWTQAYVDGLAEGGFDTIELLGSIGRSHYYDHDPHIDSEGSDFVAAAIAEHLATADRTKPADP